MKRFCQFLRLKNDPQLIEEYKYWHKSENIWPEITKGLKEIGILSMEIYIHEVQLFMIIEVADDFEWESSFAALATKERQAEWEQFVAKYQACDADASSRDKWQLMERIFQL